MNKMFVVNVAIRRPHPKFEDVFAVENDTLYFDKKPTQKQLEKFVKENKEKGVLGAMFHLIGEFTAYAEKEQKTLYYEIKEKEENGKK